MNKPNRPHIPKDYDVNTSMEATILGMFIQTGTGSASMPAISVVHSKMETFGSAEKEVMEAIYAGGHHGINYDDFMSVVTTAEGINESIKFLIEEKIVVADVQDCKELALSLPAYLLMSGTKIKTSLRYIPENYSYKNSYAALFDGLDLNKDNPVTARLMMSAGNKYLALGEVAKALLRHLYRGFQTRLTYETLLDKIKRQIKGPGPADDFFINKVAESTQQLFTEDLVYLSKDQGDELVLSPILRLVFDNDPEMRGQAQIDMRDLSKQAEVKPFIKIGVRDLSSEQAAIIFTELQKEMRYLLDNQVGVYKLESKAVPGMTFDSKACVAFVQEYTAMLEVKETPAQQDAGIGPNHKFPMMALDLIGNSIKGTANVPGNSMFVGATLADRVVPSSELRSVYEQIMSNHHISTLFASGGVIPPSSKTKLNFGGADWDVRLGEAYNFVVCYRQLMDSLGIGIKAPVLYLGNMVVTERESVAYYEEIKKEIFATESLSANYRYKPMFGALVGCLFTFEQIRQYKRDYDSMSTLIGRVIEKGIELGDTVIAHQDLRCAYDLVRANEDVQLYRKDRDGDRYALNSITIFVGGKNVTFAATQGAAFIDAFKALKKQLKKQ